MSAWFGRALIAYATMLLAGCATPPTIVAAGEDELETVTVPSLMVEYPPIEPVEPPITLPTAPPVPASAPVPAQAANAPGPVAMIPPSLVTVPPAVVDPPGEDVQLILLLSDLQRFGGMGSEEVRRELGNASQALARQRTDGNRVRLAVLYTLIRSNPQDDQRALQLLENVAKSNPGTPAVKQLAFILQAQISERLRAVRDEQQKADAALQKLEALRQMERSLIRDRARSGSAGGGGTGGSSGGGSAGGG
ncbi:MAG: hypothetical protein H0T80_16925, partial [Betaproteobacteria bacterium]|nr:hypothetical protein [Betaproteobacteria bacterium]